MHPGHLFQDALTGPPELFQRALEGKARGILMLNLTITGISFGLSNLYRGLQISPDLPMQGSFALITPALFSVFGIATMLGALLGLTLIYWSAAKAFGGPGGFGLIIDLIGLAAVPFWFLAPLLNLALNNNHDGSIPLYLLVPLILTFVWSFKLLRQSLITGQGLSEGRATLALGCMWIFSISAVYVFMP